MIFEDFHVHTSFCDGKNTPEEMVEFAISKGMKKIGFSAHSYTFFDTSYCVPKDKLSDYQNTILALKKKYARYISIYLGIERDYYARRSDDLYPYDYVIGSMHYIQKDGLYFPIDESEESLRNLIQTRFSNDAYALSDHYFDAIKTLVEKTDADIIGHFDLILKYNASLGLFDIESQRFQKAGQDAILQLLPHQKPFEINTGAICRGTTDFPYPCEPFMRFVQKNGGRFVLSGDAHSANGLCYAFETWYSYAKDLGLSVSAFQIL